MPSGAIGGAEAVDHRACRRAWRRCGSVPGDRHVILGDDGAVPGGQDQVLGVTGRGQQEQDGECDHGALHDDVIPQMVPRRARSGRPRPSRPHVARAGDLAEQSHTMTVPVARTLWAERPMPVSRSARPVPHSWRGRCGDDGPGGTAGPTALRGRAHHAANGWASGSRAWWPAHRASSSASRRRSAGRRRVPGRRPRAVRGHPRRGQDRAGQGAGPGDRRHVRAGAGHGRPAAVGPHRRHGLEDDTRQWTFHPGPLFNNVVLVDELNRATPRTQSSLLEAMAERQVTVDGTTHALPDPFFVIATQNPQGGDLGTFPLVAGQRDRFALSLSLGLPGTRRRAAGAGRGRAESGRSTGSPRWPPSRPGGRSASGSTRCSCIRWS